MSEHMIETLRCASGHGTNHIEELGCASCVGIKPAHIRELCVLVLSIGSEIVEVSTLGVMQAQQDINLNPSQSLLY